MPEAPLLHSQATGVHPGAYVQPGAPANPYTIGGVSYSLPDGVLWVDTSSGAVPYPVWRWNAGTAAWEAIQMDATGYPVPGGHRLETVPA